MEGGRTLGDHEAQIAKTMAELGQKAPEESEDIPPFPWFYKFLFDAFMELHTARSSGFTPNPVSYQEIESWCRLNRVEISPHEVRILRNLDNTVLATAESGKDGRNSRVGNKDIDEGSQTSIVGPRQAVNIRGKDRKNPR